MSSTVKEIIRKELSPATQIHSTKIIDDGETMICYEGYTQKMLVSYFEKKGYMTDPRVINDINGSSLTFPSEFILENPEEMFIHSVSSPQIDDYDVSRFVSDLLYYMDFSIDIEGKDYITMEEYYLYLVTCKEDMFECSDGTVMRIKDKDRFSIKASIFGRYISILGGVSILIHDSVISGTKRVMVPNGKIKVSDIPVWPIDNVRRKEIIEKNKKIYQQYSPVMYKTYEGVSYSVGVMGNTIKHYHKNRRVIVDNGGLKELNIDLLDSLFHDVENIDVIHENSEKINDNPHDNVLLTLCLKIAVFDLISKQWSLGSWCGIKELNVRDDAFDNLILEEKSKDMIRAITTMHEIDNTDIVDGKGSNAVFLLHGKPGTGKTLTAEAVSEMLRKPLYKVSLGELGTNVSDLEKSLNTILSLSERWDSIVLIDEADVFLEKRNIDNLERNAMVAVFLRLLEYFSGILFLTTNRAKFFDEAFVSRITLAIQYNEPEKIPLWKMLLKNSKIDLNENDIDKLAKYNVNGRQVKSAINAAKSFAKYKGQEVDVETISMFLDRSCEFGNYINSKTHKTLLNE